MSKCVMFRRVAVVMLSLAAGACDAREGEVEARFKLSDDATAADVGLPSYPGSRPSKDENESDSAANLALSTPLFGFKVVAMKLETDDKPERVAAFYHKALGKYGKVLECRDDAHVNAQASSGDELKCEPNEADDATVVYKVGTEENQRIVAVEPRGAGTQFSLVHLSIRGDLKK
ncbi:MAG TPA: hypothetical protein VIT67_18965 [Povalibacter sp.]